MKSLKDIDNSNFFDWFFLVLGTLLVIFYIGLIFQEGFGFLFRPSYDIMAPGIPEILNLILGVVAIIFSLRPILISKQSKK